MTPQEWLELFVDAEAQTEEWNRAQREEWRDASGHDHDPREDPGYPDARDLAELNAEAARDRGSGR